MQICCFYDAPVFQQAPLTAALTQWTSDSAVQAGIQANDHTAFKAGLLKEGLKPMWGAFPSLPADVQDDLLQKIVDGLGTEAFEVVPEQHHLRLLAAHRWQAISAGNDTPKHVRIVDCINLSTPFSDALVAVEAAAISGALLRAAGSPDFAQQRLPWLQSVSFRGDRTVHHHMQQLCPALAAVSTVVSLCLRDTLVAADKPAMQALHHLGPTLQRLDLAGEEASDCNALRHQGQAAALPMPSLDDLVACQLSRLTWLGIHVDSHNLMPLTAMRSLQCIAATSQTQPHRWWYSHLWGDKDGWLLHERSQRLAAAAGLVSQPVLYPASLRALMQPCPADFDFESDTESEGRRVSGHIHAGRAAQLFNAPSEVLAELAQHMTQVTSLSLCGRALPPPGTITALQCLELHTEDYGALRSAMCSSALCSRLTQLNLHWQEPLDRLCSSSSSAIAAMLLQCSALRTLQLPVLPHGLLSTRRAGRNDVCLGSAVRKLPSLRHITFSMYGQDEIPAKVAGKAAALTAALSTLSSLQLRHVELGFEEHMFLPHDDELSEANWFKLVRLHLQCLPSLKLLQISSCERDAAADKEEIRKRGVNVEVSADLYTSE